MQATDAVLIFNRFLVMLFMGGGVGIPVGMPPAPEHPVMAQVAPENCLYYSSWAAMAAPDPNSPNHTEQLLAEEEVRVFFAELEEQIRLNIRIQEQINQLDPDSVRAVESGWVLFKTVLSHPTAMFVESVAPGPNGVDVKAGMVIHLAAEEAVFRRELNAVQGLMNALDIRQLKIDGHDFYQVQPAPQAPQFTWGIHENYFILGVGTGAVEDILARRDTPPPQWLAEEQARFDVPRRATFTYADLQAIVELSAQLIADPEAARLIDVLGLDQLNTYTSVTGLDETGVVTKTLLGFEGQPTGLLALWDSQPLEADRLSRIPADATVALAIRLDPERVMNAVLDTVAEFNPQGVEFFRDQLQEAETGIGLRLREDVFAAFGDTWQVYASASEGGLMTSWTASLSVRDHRKASIVLERFVGILRGMFFPDHGMPHMGSMPFGEHTIHTFQVPETGFVVEPAFCLTQDELVVSLFPQAIKSHLNRDPTAAKLTDVPAVAEGLAHRPGPSVIAYQDTRAFFQLVYPFVQIGARMFASQLQREGLIAEMGILPSGSSIAKHLQPSVSTIRRTELGYEFESHRSLPSGSLGTTAPIGIALLLPAVQSARQAAQRMEASNNLKQIGLALHNYHDTYRAFPAAYNANQDGEALLSWRVHILPFIDQQHLYRQFRLDEPWNSEHNRKLIPLMPAVYQSPGSQNGPGKTNYLGIRGEQSLFRPPKNHVDGVVKPLGVRFADILDGSSNTIGAVEASDELSVIWTKPDDLEPDEDNPIKGLVGMRAGVFMALFCDGSVRAIDASIDPDVLRALFTINGGELVGF